MRIALYELKKIWRSSIFICGVGLLLLINIFLLWANSQFENQTVSMKSYKAIGYKLSSMSEQEKDSWLQQQLTTLDALIQIEQSLNSLTPDSQNLDIANSSLFQEYEPIYNRHEYPYFATTLQAEYQLYANIKAEFDEIYTYPLFLTNLQKRAALLSSISLFDASHSNYDYAVIQKTAKDYSSINVDALNLNYYPQKGLYTALSYKYTDIILLSILFLLAFVSVRDEIDTGLVHFIRSTKAGRFKTILGKLLALSFSLLIVVIFLYSSNLIYCHLTYGLGNLSRSIQSLPFLKRCTEPLLIYEYIIVYLIVKWLTSIVLGICIFISSFICRTDFSSWFTIIGLLGSQIAIYMIIPSVSQYNAIKYSSLISIINTNAFLGKYQNVNVNNTPVSMQLVGWGTFIGSAILLLFICILLFSKGTFNTSSASIFSTRLSLHSSKLIAISSTTIFKEEARKLYIFQRRIWLALILLLVSIFQLGNTENVLSVNDLYYKFYMDNLSGSFTKEKYHWLIEQDKQLQPLYELEQALANGAISLNEYSLQSRGNYGLILQQQTHESILQETFPWIEKNKSAQLVYEKGYEKLFSITNDADIVQALFASFATVLFCSDIFSYDKSRNITRLIKVTPLGRSVTINAKLLHTAIACMFVTIITSLPIIVPIIRDYGLPAPFASALSVKSLSQIPNWITLSDLILTWFLMRLLACECVGFIMLTFSQKLGKSVLAMIAGIVFFCLPLLLSTMGVLHIKWLSIYPLYHWIPMLVQNESSLIWFGPILAFLLIVFSYNFLQQSYQEEI